MKSKEIIKQVQLTEKGSVLTEKQNKYFLKVATDANKQQIKQAVQELFRVTVSAVNTMQCEGKKKRMRNARMGKRSDWKRAIVTLTEGSKIDLT